MLPIVHPENTTEMFHGKVAPEIGIPQPTGVMVQFLGILII